MRINIHCTAVACSLKPKGTRFDEHTELLVSGVGDLPMADHEYDSTSSPRPRDMHSAFGRFKVNIGKGRFCCLVKVAKAAIHRHQEAMAGAVKSIFRDMSVELERAIAASGDLRLRGPACQYRDPQGPRRELHNKRQMTNRSKEASRIRVLRQSSAAADCLWRSVTDRRRERAILNEKGCVAPWRHHHKPGEDR